MFIVDDEALSWPERISMARRYAYTLGARSLSTSAIAFAGLVAALSNPDAWLTWLLLAVSTLFPVVLLRRVLRPLRRSSVPIVVTLDGTATGTFVLARLVAASGTLLVVQARGASAGVVIAVVVIMGLVIAEVPARLLLVRATPYAANIAGPAGVIRNWPRISPDLAFATTTLALAVSLMVAATRGGQWGVLAVVVLAVAAMAGVVGDSLVRLKAQMRFTRGLRNHIEPFAPVFALHWDAPANTAYQVTMWLPYLERLGLPFIVVLRDETNMRDVMAATSAPVFVCGPLESLDNVVVPTLRAVLYVNTATKNSHFVRYPSLTHIQLNHGDSDKAPSYNPVMRMYDKNFVAGQAAIDRFADNGVWMPASMFVIAGRPQVEDILPAAAPICSVIEKTVLYAPTWAGFHADSQYSSLPSGEALVAALIARQCRVIFRPHPYSRHSAQSARTVERICMMLAEDRASSGRQHLFGVQAETEMSLVDCMNGADALISDISSVVGDFLFSDKPYALVSVQTRAETFQREFPVAQGGYIIEVADLAVTLAPALERLLGSDPRAATRHDLKAHYLGDFPTQGYLRSLPQCFAARSPQLTRRALASARNASMYVSFGKSPR